MGAETKARDRRSEDTLVEVTTTARVIGRKEEPLESMSHVRVYGYSPNTTALQLRAMAREGLRGREMRQVLITALLDPDEVRAVRDRLAASVQEPAEPLAPCAEPALEAAREEGQLEGANREVRRSGDREKLVAALDRLIVTCGNKEVARGLRLARSLMTQVLGEGAEEVRDER